MQNTDKGVLMNALIFKHASEEHCTNMNTNIFTGIINSVPLYISVEINVVPDRWPQAKVSLQVCICLFHCFIHHSTLTTSLVVNILVA